MSYNTSYFCRASAPSFGSLSPHPPIYIGEYQGEKFDVEIETSEVENLSKFEFTITYNPNLLQVQNVFRGNLIPPEAIFNFEVDEQNGQIIVNNSILEPHEPISGKGILVQLSFEVINSLPSNGSPISFQEVKLLNQNSEEINYRYVSAIFFWRSVEPRVPDGERYIDLFTQKGGEGLGESSESFVYGEIVTLEAYVSYADWPQQNLLVAFQVLNPLNETVLVFVTDTNEFGIAGISFRIPEIPESIGRWTVVSSVDIACEVVWDTLTFQVGSPIGGQTIQINLNIHQRLLVYLITLGFAIVLLKYRKISSTNKRIRLRRFRIHTNVKNKHIEICL